MLTVTFKIKSGGEKVIQKKKKEKCNKREVEKKRQILFTHPFFQAYNEDVPPSRTAYDKI